MEAQTKSRQSFSIADPATHITVRVPVSIHTALTHKAKEDNETMNRIVNRAILNVLGGTAND